MCLKCGHLESVLLLMICRALRYFLPCDLDYKKQKKGMQGCVGLFCPCYFFAKNAEFLGSVTLMVSCATHFIWWSLVNSFCRVLTDGIMWGLPGCFVACYACGYRRTLRSKYNLQVLELCGCYTMNTVSTLQKEAPCGDFFTHFFCHLCAKNIEKLGKGLGKFISSESDGGSYSTTLQTMESVSSK